jgi:hypothetical protein
MGTKTPETATKLAEVMGMLAYESINNPELREKFDDISDHLVSAIELIMETTR